MKIVLKIGGSLTMNSEGPDYEYIKKLIPVIEKLKSENKIIISTGAGKFFRNYVEKTNYLGLTDEQKEWIFIDLLEANKRLLSYLTGLKPLMISEIDENSEGVVGGFMPGRSTDWGAAECARISKSDMLIKLTDVDGIYSSDPKKNKDAKLLDKINFNDLKKYSKENTSPGSYGILDKKAIDVIVKNKIKTVLTNGNEPKIIEEIIKGNVKGTLIS